MDELAPKPLVLVTAEEQKKISRAVLEWLNAYEDKPVKRIDFEYLTKTSGMCISTVQAAFKTRQFINGGYQAQFQFQIVYRLIASTNDERLDADELLNAFGEWCEKYPPDLTDDINRWKVRRDTGASVMARYDNGAEDHTIQLTLFYEVI